MPKCLRSKCFVQQIDAIRTRNENSLRAKMMKEQKVSDTIEGLIGNFGDNWVSCRRNIWIEPFVYQLIAQFHVFGVCYQEIIIFFGGWKNQFYVDKREKKNMNDEFWGDQHFFWSGKGKINVFLLKFITTQVFKRNIKFRVGTKTFIDDRLWLTFGYIILPKFCF